LRFFYFITDPLGQTRDIPYYMQQLVFGLGFFFLEISFLMVVLYWVDMYYEIIKHRTLLVTKTKRLFFVLAIGMLAMEIMKRTFDGLHLKPQQENPIVDYVYFFYLASVCLGLSIGTLVYGTLVYRKSKNFPGNSDMKRIQMLTKTLTVISATFLAATICDIIVALLNKWDSPTATIWIWTVAHVLEISMNAEMLYLMTPRKSATAEKYEETNSSGSSSGSPSSPVHQNSSIGLMTISSTGSGGGSSVDAMRSSSG